MVLQCSLSSIEPKLMSANVQEIVNEYGLMPEFENYSLLFWTFPVLRIVS